MCVEEDERGGRGGEGWLVDRRSCERLNANEVFERRRCVKRLIND